MTNAFAGRWILTEGDRWLRWDMRKCRIVSALVAVATCVLPMGCKTKDEYPYSIEEVRELGALPGETYCDEFGDPTGPFRWQGASQGNAGMRVEFHIVVNGSKLTWTRGPEPGVAYVAYS